MESKRPKVISSEIVYENPRFKIRKDSLLWPDGRRGDYYLVEGRPFCIIIAEENGQILIEEQYRYQTDSVRLEFPAGMIENNESPEEAASRELLEETGYTAVEITQIGSFDGYGRIKGHVLVVRGLVKHSEPKLDASEFGLTSRWIPIEEFRALLASGKITMYATLAAWALYSATR